MQCPLQTPAYHHDSVDVADAVAELGYGQNVDHRLPGTDVA